MYIYEQKEIAKKIIVLNTKNVWGGRLCPPAQKEKHKK